MAELNFGLLNPPGSQSIGNAFVQGMDQAAVARAQENQNALSQYTLSKARREDELSNQLFGDLRNATTNEEVYRAYQRAGKGDVASKLRGDALTQKKLEGEIALQPTTAAAAQSKLIDDKLAQSRAMLEGVSTPEEYIAWHEANHADPILGKALTARGVTVEQSRARITAALQQPGGLERLINESKLGVEKFAEQNRPQNITQNTGGTTQVLSIPGLGGAATVVPGSPATVTPGPGTAPAIAQANIAAARARDEGIPVGGVPAVVPQANNMRPAAPVVNGMIGGQPVAPGVQQTAAPAVSGLSPAATRRVAEDAAKRQVPTYNKDAGGFITPPTASNPNGTFVPLVAVQTAKDVTANLKALKLSGYDHTTGKDEIAKLINESTGGILQAGAAGTLGAFNYTTEGAEAISRLGTRVKAMTLSLLDGKLGAGISNADRDFIEGQFGDIANPNIASGKRLAAWDEAKKRMLSLGMLDSPDQPKPAAAAPRAPAAAISVTTPDGKTYSFATPAQAAAFKKAAGIP